MLTFKFELGRQQHPLEGKGGEKTGLSLFPSAHRIWREEKARFGKLENYTGDSGPNIVIDTRSQEHRPTKRFITSPPNDQHLNWLQLGAPRTTLSLKIEEEDDDCFFAQTINPGE